MNKKLVLLIGFVIYGLSAYFSYSYFSENTLGIKNPLGNNQTDKNKSMTTTDDQEAVSNEPKTEECPLNGEMLTKTQRQNWEKRRPLGIMVENHQDARPQSGLSSADIVYETVAEGGITRFLSIFYCKDSNFVGPVRSARMYFIKMLQAYGDYPLYAHVGGANTDGLADALGALNTMGWASYNDLNQFSVPFPNFWRDYERLPNRATEHTVYTSTKKLWDFAKNKRKLTNVDDEGQSWDKLFTKWTFKDDLSFVKRGDLTKISFGFWSSFADQYAVSWIYNKEKNLFERENGGTAHLDKNTNKQLTAKNVIVVFMNESSANDGYEGGHILYKTTGSGKALFFQDGQAVEGTWSRLDEKTQLTFANLSGVEIAFNRGQIFIEILPTGNKVVY